MMNWLGHLLGLDDFASIDDVKVGLVAPWASDRPALVLFAMVLLTLGTVVFYLRAQHHGSRRTRRLLAVLRSVLLCGMVLILAEPVVTLIRRERQKPLLAVVIDGTESMNQNDALSSEDRAALRSAGGTTESGTPSRLEWVKSVLMAEDGATLRALSETHRLRMYVLSRGDRLVEISATDADGDPIGAPAQVAQIEATGSVTAIGSGLADLNRRHPSHRIAGVVMVSDFDQNAGVRASGEAARLGRPIHAVGIGPRTVTDLSVDVQSPPMLKKDEQATIRVHLRQSGLTGRTTRVQLLARRLGTGAGESDEGKYLPVGEPKFVELSDPTQDVALTFTPDREGSFRIEARAEGFDQEVTQRNNHASREVQVCDESMKLLFIADKPSWEWRFVKEVFQRDPLIGKQGFRTFMPTVSLRVRRSSDIYLESLIQPRGEFFQYDVILLTLGPGSRMVTPLQKMLKEYVSRFGGGLVILSSPFQKPGELANMDLASMLPVVLNPNAIRRDGEFAIQKTAAAQQYSFMQLGNSASEDTEAWANLGALPWYQPVSRLHPMATALAVHPTDRTVDGKEPQPIIASRRYGRGEVIYLGFNETWRLRRLYGEKYYRDFWGKMIYRLGLSRAMGAQKRFVVRTDRRQYRPGEKVVLSAEAYDANFEPLDIDSLSARRMVETPQGFASDTREFTVPLRRDEVVYETSFTVFEPGRHRVLVADPIAGGEVEVDIEVMATSAELRSTVRNVGLQESLATVTGGRSMELSEWNTLPSLLGDTGMWVTREHRLPIWNTWFVLLGGLVLMGTEWAIRKWIHLR